MSTSKKIYLKRDFAAGIYMSEAQQGQQFTKLGRKYHYN